MCSFIVAKIRPTYDLEYLCKQWPVCALTIGSVEKSNDYRKLLGDAGIRQGSMIYMSGEFKAIGPRQSICPSQKRNWNAPSLLAKPFFSPLNSNCIEENHLSLNAAVKDRDYSHLAIAWCIGAKL